MDREIVIQALQVSLLVLFLLGTYVLITIWLAPLIRRKWIRVSLLIVLAGGVFAAAMVAIPSFGSLVIDLIRAGGITVFTTAIGVYVERKLSQPGNPDVIHSRDSPRIIERMVESLIKDQENLNILIPLFRDSPRDTELDKTNELNASEESRLDYQTHLSADAISRHDNKDELAKLRRWGVFRNLVNKQFSWRRRDEDLDKIETEVAELLQELIDLYQWQGLPWWKRIFRPPPA